LFETLKKMFIIELILVVLDLDKKMKIEIDTSNYTMEEVLSIKCIDKRWRLVAYLLKLLNETEQNYEIHDKEILAVIRELKA